MDFRPKGSEHWDLSTVFSGERKREARIPARLFRRGLPNALPYLQDHLKDPDESQCFEEVPIASKSNPCRFHRSPLSEGLKVVHLQIRKNRIDDVLHSSWRQQPRRASAN